MMLASRVVKSQPRVALAQRPSCIRRLDSHQTTGQRIVRMQSLAITFADRELWKELATQAGVDVLAGYSVNLPNQPGAATASPGGTVLPTVKDVASGSRVVLYRDTNGWCPHCAKVWMALSEKGIAFDTVLIDLFTKPEWYSEVAANGKTPAMRLDGENMCESLDIMLALEEAFPETPLLPEDREAAAAVKEFCTWVSSVNAPVSKIFAKNFDAESEAEIKSLLDKIEATKNQLFGELSGPHLFGQFSLADIVVAPFLPVLLQSKKESINGSRHPHVKEAMLALQEKECYRVASTDPWTRQRIFGMFSQGEKAPAVDMSEFPDREMRDRREAAAKILVRRRALVQRIAAKSGVMHKPGSVYGVCFMDMNGRMVNPYEKRVEAVVEAAIQRVCVMLLKGEAGSSSTDCEAIAIQAASIAYLRNVGGSPRDMSSGAIGQLRDACDVLLQRIYEFPEPKKVEDMQKRFKERAEERSLEDAVAAEVGEVAEPAAV